MRSIAILGATGSIGTQALNLIEQHNDEYQAVALTAHSNAEALFALVRKFKPKAAGLIIEPDQIPEDLKDCEWFFGDDCSEKVILATKPMDALAAVVGIAGLSAVLCAMDVCERVLLANKEALVTGGALVMNKARDKHVQLLPVDSEHSAIFQCLQGAQGNAPHRLILTASGGPMKDWSKYRIQHATIDEALGHPTWRMGKKITIDCATMMNKGLELIEAHYLFDVAIDKIDVAVHPQSLVHSMVEYEDGSILAQLGVPDMRAAIGYAMGYPKRLPFGGQRMSFKQLLTMTFEAPDLDRFACLQLAKDAIRAGGSMPVILNGANEEAVNAFLRGELSFGRIAEVVSHAMDRIASTSIQNVEAVYAADARARAVAIEIIKG